MDFNLGDEQRTVRDLARGILEKEMTPERLKRIGGGLDRALWTTLAEAGLLGLAVPADLGGMGLGLLEVCVLLHELGRAVAPVPALPTLILAGLALAEFGTDAQKSAWLVPMAAGEVLMSGALEDAASAEPAEPATRARPYEDGWLLEGEKRLVAAADVAQCILVPARTDEGAGIFLVDPRAEGVTLIRHGTSVGGPLFTVELAGARLDAPRLLGGDTRSGGEIARWMHERAVVAVCAMQIGVCEKALELTSGYVRERIQFGVPIGSFQAVQHRAADCYIDLEAMRWVTWRAAWKLAHGLPASRDVAVAKFWAADAGARIAAAAQHLHAGIGVDVDYPIHRYSLWSKALELHLGGAMPHLARLGRNLAQNGPCDPT